MVGVTLSAEQIRRAPQDVRRWLEQEMVASFGLLPPASDGGSIELAALSIEDAAKVLSLVQGIIPAINVFFELGHEGASVGLHGIEAFRLVDILRHARLQTVDQVVNCLDTINDAVRRVQGDGDASFYALDGEGFCFIATQTKTSIMGLWQQLVAQRDSLSLNATMLNLGKSGEATKSFYQSAEGSSVQPPAAYFDPPPAWARPAAQAASVDAEPGTGLVSASV